MTPKNRNGWKSLVFLMGSFTFAFLLAEMVHELGHYLAHLYYGTPDVGIHLDPFGGSRIKGVTSLPREAIGMTTAAGPALSLIAGLSVFLVLSREKRPIRFPLLLWAPIALVQEGVNFSLGLLSPGSDANWLVDVGTPPPLLLILGIILLLSGVVLLSSLLELADLNQGLSLTNRFLILLGGISTLMLFRAGISLRISPQATLENLVPLVFAVILGILVIAVQSLRFRYASESQNQPAGPISWSAAAMAGSLGIALLIFQIIAP